MFRYRNSILWGVLAILLLTIIACGSSPSITPTHPFTSIPGKDDDNNVDGNNGDQAAAPTDTPASIQPSPMPAPNDTPASVPPTPFPTLVPAPDAIRITFDAGAVSATHTGVLQDDIHNFLINVQAGQTMSITVEADGDVGLTVVTPSGQPLKHSAVGGPAFSGKLPESGDYHIIVVSLYTGVGPINYTLNITIPPLRIQISQQAAQPESEPA